MKRIGLLVAGAVILAACASDTITTTTTATTPTTTTTTEATTTTTVPATTTTTVATVSAEDAATVIALVDEWNSGDTDRWRATFTEDAVQTFGQPTPINGFRVEYEFFAALGKQLVLGECAPIADAIRCEATSTNRFHDLLSSEPVTSAHTFYLEGGLIYSYTAAYNGAEDLLSAWVEMRDWVNETHGVDIGGFLGNVEGATLALDYMDDWASQR